MISTNHRREKKILLVQNSANQRREKKWILLVENSANQRREKMNFVGWKFNQSSKRKKRIVLVKNSAIQRSEKKMNFFGSKIHEILPKLIKSSLGAWMRYEQDFWIGKGLGK